MQRMPTRIDQRNTKFEILCCDCVVEQTVALLVTVLGLNAIGN